MLLGVTFFKKAPFLPMPLLGLRPGEGKWYILLPSVCEFGLGDLSVFVMSIFLLKCLLLKLQLQELQSR